MKPGAAGPTVVRSLGLAAAASIAISNMIGQGIFLKARAMTCDAGSSIGMLAAWGAAGVLAVCGALTLSELGAAVPESGGIYRFLRRAYGEGVAFAYGWMSLFIASPASIAALGAGGGIFFNVAAGHVLDAVGIHFELAGLAFSVSGVQLAALALIALVTAVNCAPAIVNGGIATGFAALKISMLVVLTVVAFALGHGSVDHFASAAVVGTCDGIAASARGGVPGFAAALIGALYAYQGWHSLTLVAGEVKQPGRTLPLALISSVSLVIALYVSANAAFLYVLGPTIIENLAPNASVGVTVVKALFGPGAQTFAAALLFASVIATLHVTVLSNARVTYALAGDRLGITALARVSERGRVPVNAVIANSAFAAVLVLAGTFDTLSNYLVFNIWVFFVAAGVGMFVLRRTEPSMPRPYRTFGYPVVPAVYVGVGTWLLVQTAISSPQPSFIGLALVAASIPVYLVRRRYVRQRDELVVS